MISNVVNSFWVWCHLNSISTGLKLHFYIAVLWRFCRITWFLNLSFLVYSWKQKRSLHVKLYFLVYKAQIPLDLFLDYFNNFLSVKTEVNKNGFNFINLETPNALVKQIPAIWLAMWLTHFKFDVIWTALQLVFEATFSHSSVIAFLNDFYDFRVFVFD